MKDVLKIKEATKYIENLIEIKPEILIILGSGLGDLAEEVVNEIEISYSDIPHFPVSTVSGHDGKFVIGKFQSRNVIMMKGRFHYYEGYSMDDITMPIAVCKLLGVKSMVVTNAAGGININFSPGDLMIIDDHIKLIYDSPLRGKHIEEMGPRFNDMTYTYSREYTELVLKIAYEQNVDIKRGVYAYMTGPSYETPAEIKALRVLGADAVGMSTVPESILGSNIGMKILGISLITNMAAGILENKLSHMEVIETAKKAKEKFVKLMKSVIERM